MESIFYVYVYVDPTKPASCYGDIELPGEPFYVGKGYASRCMAHLQPSKLKRKCHLSNRLNKMLAAGIEPLVIKLYENVEEVYAFEQEVRYIRIIGRRIDKTGPLVNVTLGGEGPSGYVHTVEAKAKMSMPGELHPMWGKTPSDKTRRLLSIGKLGDLNPMKRPEVVAKFKAANKGRVAHNKGNIMSEAQVAKLRAKKQRITNITATDKNSGIISKFATVAEAAHFFGKSLATIYNALRAGESPTHTWHHDTIS